MYEAWDRETEQKVALKVLKDLDPDAVADFKREFRAIADLEHPNLVKLGELIAAEDQWLFTMELVDGVDFLTFTRDQRGPDAERLRDALAQLGVALMALHGSGQVHRDVKPSNVLVRGDGCVKLLDFGLTASTENLAHVADDEPAVGTTAYVAPEQAAGRPTGPEADWYSVGVMLYEALTGRLPFDGPPLKILVDKQTRPPVPPSELVGLVDRELEKVCLDLLQADPADRPTGEKLIKRLRSKESRRNTTQPTRSHAFFGRDTELEQLAGIVERARTQGAYLCVVEGVAGIGKSALLLRLARRLEQSGMRVLSGRCRQQESVPYRAFDGVLDALARQLGALSLEDIQAIMPRHAGLLGQTFPALTRVEAVARAPLEGERVADPLEQRRRAFAALRELLSGLSRSHAIAILLDDFHWTDADSVALLRALTARPNAPAVAYLVTVDPAPLGADDSRVDMTALKRDLGLPYEEVPLRGLDQETAVRLAQHLLDADPAPGAPSPDAVANEAEGHPRLIEELLHHVREHGVPATGQLRVEDMVRARTEPLEKNARHLLELLAVSAMPVPHEVLRQGADLEPASLARELTGLRLARLVRSGGGTGRERVELHHGRVRETVLQNLGAQGRRERHRELALAMEAVHAEDFEALSRHWRGAGELERAARYATQAADGAQAALAFERAAQLYELALQLHGERPDPALYERYGDALIAAGRGADGARAYLAAAEGKSGHDALDLRRRAAEQLMLGGRITEGLEAAKLVMDEIQLSVPTTPGSDWLWRRWLQFRLSVRGLDFVERDTSEVAARELVRVDTCWSLVVGLASATPLQVPDALLQHLWLALKAGEPYRVGRALAAMSVFASFDSGRNPDRADELAARAEGLSQRLDEPHLKGLCQLSRGVRHFQRGEFEDALKVLGKAERTFNERCRGVIWELGTTHLFAALCQLAQGDVQGLVRQAPRWTERAVARADRSTIASLRIKALANMYLLTGRGERARPEIEDAVQPPPAQVFEIHHLWRELGLIECDLHEGKTSDAQQRMDSVWPRLQRAPISNLGWVRIEALWLRARVALGDHAANDKPALLKRALADATSLGKQPLAGSVAYAEAIRAGAAELQGQPAEAVRLWRGAEARFDEEGRVLLARLAQLRGARVDPTAAGSADARKEALQWLEQVGVRDPEGLLPVLLPGGTLAQEPGLEDRLGPDSAA